MNETKITVELRKCFIEICVNYILHFKEDKLNIQTKKKKKSGIYNKNTMNYSQSTDGTINSADASSPETGLSSRKPLNG